MKTRSLAASLGLAFSLGCTHLSVEVDSYKGELPLSRETVEQEARRLAIRFEPAVVERDFEDAREVLFDEIQRELAKTNTPREELIAGRKTLEPLIDSAWEPVATSIAQVHQIAGTLASSAALATGRALDETQRVQLDQLRSAIGRAARERDAFVVQARTALCASVGTTACDRIAPKIDATFSNVVALRGIAANAEVAGRLVGTPLFDPQIAFLDRNRANWGEFSDSRFLAFGGDAQFVVVQEGLVVFREKSLDFDPTPVAGAGTAVARVGLRVAAVAAAGYGIPLGGLVPSGTPDVSAPPPTYDETQSDGHRALLARRSAARRQALASMASLLERASQPGAAANLAALRNELGSLIRFYQGQASASGGK
jgi:hypothetical protein